MCSSIIGNFIAAGIAKLVGYRRTIVWMLLGYFAAMFITYGATRDYRSVLWCLPALGASSGLFGLFTMYLPPLFPTLLRTTGAGFCYNIGRIAAAVGTVFFGLFREVGDFRFALMYASFLFLPAAAAAMFLPEPPDETPLRNN
jgi:MFS family permease